MRTDLLDGVSKTSRGARLIGLDISDNMYFVRGLQALNLNDMQRMAIISALSQSGNPQCPQKLKELSTKVTTPAFKVDKSDEILRNDPEWNVNGQTENETYVAKGKPRNRPGLEQAEVRVANQHVNFPNHPKGNVPRPQCFRCQSFDHLARECHLPIQRVPAFGGKQKGKPLVRKGKRPIMLAEQVPGQ